MTNSIPPQVSEAINGAMLVLFVFGAWVFARYLSQVWRSRQHGAGWRLLYTPENKTAIALLTLMVGLTLKTCAAWWALHLHNHGLHPNFPVLTPMIVGGALIAIWGVICLIRSLSRYERPRWEWIWLSCGAIAFGIIFSL